MLLCIPLLAFNIFQFDYRADGLVAVQAMAENGASKEAIQSSANVILNQEHTKGYVLWFKVNKTFHIVPKKTSEIDKMRENDDLEQKVKKYYSCFIKRTATINIPCRL